MFNIIAFFWAVSLVGIVNVIRCYINPLMVMVFLQPTVNSINIFGWYTISIHKVISPITTPMSSLSAKGYGSNFY